MLSLSTVVVDGMPLLRSTQEEFVSSVMQAMSRRDGIHILTVNVDILRRYSTDAQYRGLLGRFVAVADGMPLVWASRLLGERLPERVAGSDLTRSLPLAALRSGRRVLLLGGHDGVAERAAALFVEEAGAEGAVHACGLPDPLEFDEVTLSTTRARIAAVRPDLVLVSLGSPKTEQLVYHVRSSAPDATWIGVGAGLDFLAGRVARAPEAVQRMGLEWFWRLCQEPSRLARRYLVDDAPYAIGLMARCAWRATRKRMTGRYRS
jgi:N-acetylglucosaminyldiphosphoundecaprenol N-acetyl-beta-D-mannosaminyltransferase